MSVRSGPGHPRRRPTSKHLRCQCRKDLYPVESSLLTISSQLQVFATTQTPSSPENPVSVRHPPRRSNGDRRPTENLSGHSSDLSGSHPYSRPKSRPRRPLFQVSQVSRTRESTCGRHPSFRDKSRNSLLSSEALRVFMKHGTLTPTPWVPDNYRTLRG